MMAPDDSTASQFEVLRKRAKQDIGNQTQQEQEGLRRRFASMGNLNSGAAIRAESMAEQAGAERFDKVNENIGMQEIGEKQRRKELEEGRAFATSERQAGQSFVTQQALEQRKFEAEQGGLNRDFQKGLADQTAGLQKDALNAQISQFEKQFSEDQDVNDINALIAQVVAGIMSGAQGKVDIWGIQTKNGSQKINGASNKVASASDLSSNSETPTYNSMGLPNTNN